MKRWMPLALATAVVLLIACADGPPTAVPDDMETPAALASAVALEIVEVPIDVKPEAVTDGLVTVRTSRRVAVALDVNENLDVETVDPTTVRLTIGDAELKPLHNLTRPAAFTAHLKDVYPVDLPDGVIDYLVFHFDPAGITTGKSNACLTGSTTDAVPFRGCELVKVK